MATEGRFKHRVRLGVERRAELEAIARNGVSRVKRVLHARVLLMADEDHPLGRYKDGQIAAAPGLHVNTVARVRKAFAAGGVAPALERRPRLTPPTPPRIDGRAEAHLIAICCSPPPAGRERWTLSLLAGELVGRKIVTSVCVETVRKTLKKTSSSPGGWTPGACPSVTGRGSWPRWRTSWTSTPPRPTPTSR